MKLNSIYTSQLEQLKIKTTNTAYLIGIMNVFILAIINFFIRNYTLAVVETLITIVALLLLFKFRNLPDRYQNFLSATGAVLVSIAIITGGASDTGLISMVTYTASIFFLRGIRSGLMCSLTFFIASILAIILSSYGVYDVPFSNMQLFISILGSLNVSYIGYSSIKVIKCNRASLEKTISELRDANEKAEKAMLAKNNFLAHVSHELRTPLNGVIGLADILQHSELNDENHEIIDMIHNSGTVLLSLINNILDLATIESDKITISNNLFSLRNMLTDVSHLVTSLAEKKGLEIIIDYDEDLYEMAVGDEKLLRQVMINLCGNAVKFTNHGHVILRVTKVFYGLNQKIRFEVSDTGVGIPKNQQALVFEKFGQSSKTKNSCEGSGIGLTICDRLVSLMGGKLAIKSSDEFGTTFRFELSLETQYASPETDKNFNHQRILLVDSYKPITEVLQRSLLSLNAHIDIVSQDNLSDETYGAERYDFVIINIQDLITAQKVTAEIKQIFKFNMPEIFILKPSSLLISKSDFARYGIDGYLNKPITKSEIYQRLLNHNDSKNENNQELALENLEVLIVDDNAVNRKVAEKCLEKLGCKCDLAKNGREGIDAALKKNYDLILMDCQMPEVDGYEATTEIRKNEVAASKTPTIIIAVTANAMEKDHLKCIQVGMNSYLTKPFDIKKLKSAIDQQCQNVNYSDSDV